MLIMRKFYQILTIRYVPIIYWQYDIQLGNVSSLKVWNIHHFGK